MKQTTIKFEKGIKFLNVLCALTFIGAAIAIFITAIAAWVLYTQPTSDKGSLYETSPSAQVAYITLLIHFIGAILCVLGAINIMKLKKSGFYAFIIGVLVPDILSGIVFGKIFFSGIMLLVFIVPLLFIILFGLYYKKMK